MTSFSHNEYGRKLAFKSSRRIQELYNILSKKVDIEFAKSLDEASRERYIIGIEEENRKLKESLWHIVEG